MSDYMTDISGYLLGTNALTSSGSGAKVNSTGDNTSLDMTDFLSLMVAQFQNQTIDNTADTSDMLNQLVQMSTIQAITNITDATVMMYAGSLVGKEVTVGVYDSEGNLQELVGTVTGTGVSGGQQVIFVNGESYYLNQLMAVGRLPEQEEGTTGGTQTPTVENTQSTTSSETQSSGTDTFIGEENPDLNFDAPGVVG